MLRLPPGPDRHRLGLIGSAITQLRPDQRERVRDALRDRVGDDPALDGLSREELQKLAAGGFELGCHTTRHDFLPVLTPEELDESVRSGRDEIEEVAGRPVRVFAYPSGGWDAAARDAVERRGLQRRLHGARAASSPRTRTDSPCRGSRRPRATPPSSRT